MYAVVSSGGKQYRLCAGDVVDLERIAGSVGDQVVLEPVLFVGGEESAKVGEPAVEGAKVVGTILEQGKGHKQIVFKFKRRKMYRRKNGHRQLLTRIRVDSILPTGVAAAPAEPTPKASNRNSKAAESDSEAEG